MLVFSRFNHSNAHIHKAVSPCCVSKDRLENPFTGLKNTSGPSYVSDALSHFRTVALFVVHFYFFLFCPIFDMFPHV